MQSQQESIMDIKLTETGILLLKRYHTRREETAEPKTISFCQRETSILLLETDRNNISKIRKHYSLHRLSHSLVFPSIYLSLLTHHKCHYSVSKSTNTFYRRQLGKKTRTIWISALTLCSNLKPYRQLESINQRKKKYSYNPN